MKRQMRKLKGFKMRFRTFLYRTNLVFFVECVRELRALLFRKSYSQYNEDKIILQLLSNQKGYYLDIGSGRPISGSNTYALYRLGWSGTAIDPLLNNARLFRLFRHRDRFLNAVVGANKQSIEFYEFEQYVYSTFYREAAEYAIIHNQAKLRKITKIKNHFLDSSDLQKLNHFPSVLSIDCEGADFNILKSIDFSRYRPTIICVELFRSQSLDVNQNISAFLLEKNYQLISSTVLNGLFVSGEYILKLRMK
jgi:Methyltransferase FkbM domain